MPELETSRFGNIRQLSLIIAPLLSIAIMIFADLDPGNPKLTYCFALAILMAFWWITEAVPLAVTALLPVALFPLFGIVDGKTVSSLYFNYIIFLFLGGFLMAFAMERWNLHRRIALKILILFGISPGKILLGFMLSTAFLSMWMSNTATAMMMVPIALSIIFKLEESLGEKKMGKYGLGLLFGIAYSSSIGGIATLVGTPPNALFASVSSIIFKEMPEITFANWFIFAFPVTVLIFIISWFLLYFMYKPRESWQHVQIDEFRREYAALGKMKQEERIVLILFIILAFLWIFRAGITIQSFTIPGWSQLLKEPSYINDGTVAIFVSLLLFMIPSKSKSGTKLMDWETAKKIPWGIILLFGGGFALAEGFVQSGLSVWFGEQLSGLANVPPIVITLSVVTMMSFLTELTSNVASTEMILPILAGLSTTIKMNPLLLMIPATIAASLAFMLPVATPPNAIIFGTNRLQVKDMVKTGFILNLCGVIIATLIMYFWGTIVFDIQVTEFPDWAGSALLQK